MESRAWGKLYWLVHLHLYQSYPPVLFIDVEGGTLTLNNFADTADVDVVRVSDWLAMQRVYDDLRESNGTCSSCHCHIYIRGWG